MENKKDLDKSPIKAVFQFVAPYKLWLALRIFGAVIHAGVDIFMAYIIIRVVNASISGDHKKLTSTILLMVLADLAGLMAICINRYVSGKLSAFIMRDMRNSLAGHIERLPARHMENLNSGQATSRMVNDIQIIGNFIESNLPNLFFQPLRLAGAFVYMLLINWKLLLFCSLILPLMMILAAWIGKPIAHHTKKLQEELGEINSITQDCIGGIHILKTYNLHNKLLGKFKSAVFNALDNSLVIEKKHAFITALNILIQLLPYVLCFIYGGYLSVNGQLTAGGLIAFIQLLNYIVQPASVIPNLLNQLQSAKGAAGHLFEAMNEKAERNDGSVFSTDSCPDAIRFHEVSFAYGGESKVLNRVSFSIPLDKTIAFVGASGCGKSTILKLACGFYEPVEGTISLFGEDLRYWMPEEARSKISLVPQDSHLFPVSIAENISYGRSDASMEEITSAARSAGAHDFILQLPEGYHTVIGERGATLSGGQRQRISIARALLKNAPILILDEPTSALDMESEAIVQQAFKNISGGRTILIVAHRLSTIKNADLVIVLEEGKIAGMGTHNDLLRNNTIYRNLYSKQFVRKDYETNDQIQEVTYNESYSSVG